MDFKDRQPIYRQILDRIFEQILSGELKAGDKMKSIRELAVAYEVNPNTIMRSYEYLQNHEIISNKRGIGFFVNDNASEIIHSIRKKEFMEVEVPQFLKNLNLLNIDIEEIVKMDKK